MGARLSPVDKSRLVEWLRANRANYPTMTECFKAAVATLALPLMATSSNVFRYSKLVNSEEQSMDTRSASQRIRAGEQVIKAALLDIDVERSQLTQRLKELDTMAAKYRNL